MWRHRVDRRRWLVSATLLATTAALGLSACGSSAAGPTSSSSSTSSSPSTSSTSSSPGTSSATSSSATSSSSSQSSASASAGEGIFVSAGCGSCHTLAAAHTSGQVGPNLDQLKPSDAAVVSQVTNGGAGMPSFAGKLTTSQIQSLARFVASATQ